MIISGGLPTESRGMEMVLTISIQRSEGQGLPSIIDQKPKKFDAYTRVICLMVCGCLAGPGSTFLISPELMEWTLHLSNIAVDFYGVRSLFLHDLYELVF